MKNLCRIVFPYLSRLSLQLNKAISFYYNIDVIASYMFFILSQWRRFKTHLLLSKGIRWSCISSISTIPNQSKNNEINTQAWFMCSFDIWNKRHDMYRAYLEETPRQCHDTWHNFYLHTSCKRHIINRSIFIVLDAQIFTLIHLYFQKCNY